MPYQFMVMFNLKIHIENLHVQAFEYVLNACILCNESTQFFSWEIYLKFLVQVIHKSVVTKVSSGDVASVNNFLK